MRGKYKTKQRDLILTLLIDAGGKHVTAETIKERLKGTAGQSTIYRNLDMLAAEGYILKYDMPGVQAACYRYVGDEGHDEDGFCHFLCTDCGQILHLTCDKLNDLSSHVKKDHGMSLNRQKTVLYGSCRDCVANKDNTISAPKS